MYMRVELSADDTKTVEQGTLYVTLERGMCAWPKGTVVVGVCVGDKKSFLPIQIGKSPYSWIPTDSSALPPMRELTVDDVMVPTDQCESN